MKKTDITPGALLGWRNRDAATPVLSIASGPLWVQPVRESAYMRSPIVGYRITTDGGLKGNGVAVLQPSNNELRKDILHWGSMGFQEAANPIARDVIDYAVSVGKKIGNGETVDFAEDTFTRWDWVIVRGAYLVGQYKELINLARERERESKEWRDQHNAAAEKNEARRAAIIESLAALGIQDDVHRTPLDSGTSPHGCVSFDTLEKLITMLPQKTD